MASPPHISWFVDTGEVLQTDDGSEVKVLEFQHQEDAHMLRAWALHFRKHYCLDEEIDELREGTGLTRAQYLLANIFPHKTEGFGPSVRSGDFAEILVADYLQFGVRYVWMVDPKTRKAWRCTPGAMIEAQELRTENPAMVVPLEELFT